MYTLQNNLLDGLLHSGTDPVLVDVLRSIMGACQASLEHRGPINLEMSYPAGATAAALTVTNGSIAPENAYTPSPSNGYAAIFNGAVRFNGPTRGGGIWGRASGIWVNALGNYDSYVDVIVVADKDGTAVSPQVTYRVYLPQSSSMDPNVRANDVIHFWLDRDGKAICDDPFVYDLPIGSVRWIEGDPGIYPSRGWGIADGTGGAIDMGGMLPYGYKSGDPTFGTVGGSVASDFDAPVEGDASDISTSDTALAIVFDSESVEASAGTPIDVVSAEPGFEPLINPDPHSHTIASDDIAATLSIGTPTVNQPPGKVLLCLQRVD